MVQSEEKFEFKAEVKQLLDILAHSLYSSREIFLRELISNSSDALDKLRFESTKGTPINDSSLPLEIKITFDKDKKWLKIRDTGIGLTKDELIQNLGTIAKSGSAEFVKSLKESNQSADNIIGKFGVGFYSVFMVAQEVIVTTKSYKEGSPVLEWHSDGLGDFAIKELDEKFDRGTEIKVMLKDDALEFAEDYRLESIIKKHSNFISFPVLVKDKVVNTTKAIWREPKSSLNDEKYNEFYKFLTYDNDNPTGVIHLSVDAPIQYNCLLFIPKKNTDPFGMNREKFGLDLYVRKVLIQHECKDLIPEYLGFVKGVVDSEDLPLNISRETLQEDIIFRKISSSITSQILNFLTKKSNDEPEWFKDFWTEHGKLFKLGYMDFSNQEKFSELLRFNSSASTDENELIKLSDYVSRLKENQKEIYYILGANRAAVEINPHLEIFSRKGIEVLYLYDVLDEFVISSVRKYKEYDYKSVDIADISKIEAMPDKLEEVKVAPLSKDDELHFSSLLGTIKALLGEKVTDVKESKRLTSSPVCLASVDDGMSDAMMKMFKMMNKDESVTKKILEVNKNNEVVRNLLSIYKKDAKDEFLKLAVEQLYDAALLLDGEFSGAQSMASRVFVMLDKSAKMYQK